MGQPIHLVKDGDTLIVYGQAYAATMIGRGWRMAADDAPPEPGSAAPPAATLDVTPDAAPPAPVKPRRKGRK